MQSPPLIERLREMMSNSDNVMAESIGREVAAAQGKPQSFEGAVRAVLGELNSAKIDTGGSHLMDCSGLSVDDRLTAETLDEAVSAAAGNDQPKLRPLVDLLPIAGGSGTLSNRFLDTDAGRASAGWLRAKTGSLTGTNSLVGIVTDSSGRVLTFALHLQQRGSVRSHRDRRAGRDAAVVWVQHMSRRAPRQRSTSAARSTGGSPPPSGPSSPARAPRPPSTPAVRWSTSWPVLRCAPNCPCEK